MKLQKTMRKNLYLMVGISLLVLFLFLPFISAVPPVQTTIQEQSLTIAYPQYQFVKIDSDFTLYIHVQNNSNLLKGPTISCWLDLYNSTGQETMRSRLLEGEADYYIPIFNNFTDLGLHSFVIQCNTTSQAGFANGIFEVTRTGVIVNDGMYFTLGSILLILFGINILFLYLGFRIENPSLKIFFFLLSFMFLIGTLGTALFVCVDYNLTSGTITILTMFLYGVGLITFIIFALILIQRITSALDMMRQKKGYETGI